MPYRRNALEIELGLREVNLQISREPIFGIGSRAPVSYMPIDVTIEIRGVHLSMDTSNLTVEPIMPGRYRLILEPISDEIEREVEE